MTGWLRSMTDRVFSSCSSAETLCTVVHVNGVSEYPDHTTRVCSFRRPVLCKACLLNSSVDMCDHRGGLPGPFWLGLGGEGTQFSPVT